MTADAVVRAAVLIDASKWREALELLGPHVAETPDDGHAWCLITQCELGQGRVGPAIDASTEAVRATPDSEWAHRLRSIALMRRRNYREAYKEAEECVRLAPSFWLAHYQRAQVELDEGQLTDRGWDAAYKALELAPDEPQTHSLVALAAMKVGMRDLAIKEYQEVLRLDPDNTAARNNLSILHLRHRRFGLAARHLVDALRLSPNDPKLLANLRQTLRLFGTTLAGLGLIGCLLAVIETNGRDISTGVVPASVVSLPAPATTIVVTVEPARTLSRHIAATGRPVALLVTAVALVVLVLLASVMLRRALGRGARRILWRAIGEDRVLLLGLTTNVVAIIAISAAAALGMPHGRALIWIGAGLSLLGVVTAKGISQNTRGRTVSQRYFR